MDKFTASANMASFLLEKMGSVCGVWSGSMPAKEQRALFGQFIGKGTITIDGNDETLKHVKKVCFGADWIETFYRTWKAL